MRPLSVAFAVLVLIVSALFVVVPSGAHASAPPALRVHPAATDSIAPTDAFGGYDFTFQTGYQNGAVYFQAYDPSGDTSAVVSINDYNATRDGLANPVAHWTVTFSPTNSYNDSYYWNAYYQIPLNLPFGGTWNITIKGTTAGFASTNFTVQNYYAYMTPTSPEWLAGHTGTVLYNINNTANNSPWTNVTSVTVLATYYSSTSGKYIAVPTFPRNLAATSVGSFPVNLPSDAQNSVQFLLWANVSQSNAKVSEIASLSVPVATMDNPQVTLATCPTPSCATSDFADGTPVYVLIHAYVSSYRGSDPGANLTAKVQFERGTTIVSPTGGGPTTLTTNASGRAALLFVASSSVFSTSSSNAVVVTLSDPANTAATPTTSTVNFFVFTTTGFARLAVQLDALQYYDGDTATATWTIGGNNASAAAGWTVDSWQVWSVSAGTLLASGAIGSTATSGTFNFVVPAGLGGEVRASVSAHNATAWLSADAFALATAPTILLNPNAVYYLPGGTVTVQVTTFGSALSNAQLWQTVVDSSGNTLVSGMLTGNQIQFTIPKVSAPSDVHISVAAQDPTAGILAMATTTVYEGSGYVMAAGIDSVSNYVDGSFQPGQKISIHYDITAVGSVVLPKTYTIWIYPSASFFGSGYGEMQIETSSPSGTIDYTIPSGTPRGGQGFILEAEMGSCLSNCYASTQFTVDVNPNPSALSYEVGAGSGLTVGWLILFVLGLIVVIVGVLWMRRRGGRSSFSEGAKPYTPPTTSAPAPRSDAPSQPGAAPWKEGSSGGSSTSSPPLPTPPSG